VVPVALGSTYGPHGNWHGIGEGKLVGEMNTGSLWMSKSESDRPDLQCGIQRGSSKAPAGTAFFVSGGELHRWIAPTAFAGSGWWRLEGSLAVGKEAQEAHSHRSAERNLI
jgi:hypothetical protein